ncbi:hypothetical protein PR048_029592 [Dryococelus australis]|uniref:Uncharacterized protein n=1 Tax=Dryococelus australis TaxID=614101 RepID=A0ABQ9GGB3_9NEOP|nr:hypothetical protein PR048_029592 [Dryococelus australis]
MEKLPYDARISSVFSRAKWRDELKEQSFNTQMLLRCHHGVVDSASTYRDKGSDRASHPSTSKCRGLLTMVPVSDCESERLRTGDNLRSKVQLSSSSHAFLFTAQRLLTMYARLHHCGSKLDPRPDLRSTHKSVAPFWFRAGLEIEMKLISISHYGTKIDESEIENHEISLVQHFYIGTKIKLDPSSGLGSSLIWYRRRCLCNRALNKQYLSHQYSPLHDHQSWRHGGRAVSLLASHQREPVFNPRPGLSRIFARGNRAGQWSVGLLEDLPLTPPLHSGAAPYSPHFTLICSQDLDVTATQFSPLHSKTMHALDDSAPIADLQENKKRIPCCQMWSNTGATANEQTAEIRLYSGLWSLSYSLCCQQVVRGPRPDPAQHPNTEFTARFPGSREVRRVTRTSPGDKVDLKHVYTEVDIAIGSQFITLTLDDSEPMADLQGNK